MPSSTSEPYPALSLVTSMNASFCGLMTMCPHSWECAKLGNVCQPWALAIVKHEMMLCWTYAFVGHKGVGGEGFLRLLLNSGEIWYFVKSLLQCKFTLTLQGLGVRSLPLLRTKHKCHSLFLKRDIHRNNVPSKYTLGSSPIIFTFREATSMGLAGTWWSQNLYQWVVKRNCLIPQSLLCPAWWYLSALKSPTPKGWNSLFLGWDDCFGCHLYTTRKHKEPLSYIWAFP